VAPFSLTVVVPCLNEADNVVPAYEEIVAELGRYDALEILFVDDGSTDPTLARIRDLTGRDRRVTYVSFSRNFGLEAAFSAGYRYARGEWILHLDADLQFPPTEAHRLIAAARAGHDAVFGVRVDRKDRLLRRVSSRVHDLIARRLLHIEIPAGATTFRLVRASLARRVVALDLGTPYFLANIPKLTGRWTTVPTAHRARERGEPKVRFRGLARHSVELFVSYSDRPMAATVGWLLVAALASVAGATAGALGATRAGLALFGWAAAIGFTAFALTARYLVHIARGRRTHPMYLIRETNLPVDPADLLDPGDTGTGRDLTAAPAAATQLVEVGR
jgi:glycosyltransferase involved in cell wall biosynthesis